MKNKKLFAILTLVCFMFTLMPVAAFAATDLEIAQNSYVYVDDADVDVNEEVEITVDTDASVNEVYVWFEAKANVPSTALVGIVDGAAAVDGIVAVPVVNGAANVEVAFSKAGTYEVHASLKAPVQNPTWADGIADVADFELQTEAGYEKVTVSADSADSDDYVIVFGDKVYEDGDTINIAVSDEKANGIEETAISFVVYEDGTKAEVIYANNAEITTSAKASVNDVKAKRNGEVSFDLVVEKAGTHKVVVAIDDFKVTFKIDAREGKAEKIELAYTTRTAVNIKSANALVDTASGLGKWLVFKVYDVNGTEITAWTSADGGLTKKCAGTASTNYVTLTEKPADSRLKSENFYLVPVVAATSALDKGWTIKGADFDEEGTYTFKVALDDGTYATASITVQESDDYVALSISYFTDTVTLGGSIAPRSISWLDKDRVSTTATDVEFAVTGAAVKSVDAATKTIYVKDDEKYVGSKIEVTVVDEENNLVATKTLTVATEAKGLAFDVTTIPVDSQKTVTVKLVDETGAAVALTGVTTAEAYAIVLDKPANSDVTISDAKDVAAKKGLFKFDMSADTVGIVKIQAVLKAEVNGVVRYYTGVQEINVGAAGIEDTVVMSIGSNEIVINGEVKTIDAAPIVENSRTFIPFRALAEAFGATVAFDEATQAVTAELDGVTVVMTIGSAEYTVNGVVKTADVAPFINGSRTMVPVRFVAEAFGITVTPTYNDNGTTADIVFAK